MNLIGNAIKFTFNGYVKIKFSLIEIKDVKRKCIKVSVEDTGIGIRKKHHKKLFKLFSMIEDSKN